MKQFYNHIFRFGKYLQDQKFLSAAKSKILSSHDWKMTFQLFIYLSSIVIINNLLIISYYRWKLCPAKSPNSSFEWIVFKIFCELN